MKLSQAKRMWCAPNKDLWLQKQFKLGWAKGGVKKTWLDSTRLYHPCKSFCFKLSHFVFFFRQNTVKFFVGVVSKSLIKITKPWKEGRGKSFQLSKQTVYAHDKKTHPKSLWVQKLDQSPNLISFLFCILNWETFQAKNSATNFFLFFFSLIFTLCSFIFPLFWGGEDEESYYGVCNKYLLDFGSYLRS